MLLTLKYCESRMLDKYKLVKKERMAGWNEATASNQKRKKK